MIPAAPLDSVPENGSRCVMVAGRAVLLCRSSAGVFAVENKCSHQESPLEGGKVRAAFIFCPLHGVRFDMRTGAPSGELTKTPIATWETRVENGMVMVALE